MVQLDKGNHGIYFNGPSELFRYHGYGIDDGRQKEPQRKGGYDKVFNIPYKHRQTGNYGNHAKCENHMDYDDQRQPNPGKMKVAFKKQVDQKHTKPETV